MMAGEKPKDILCDLCEEEEATTFCDECQSKVCESCKKAHVKQKRTKDHTLADVDQVKLSILKVSCSLCDGQAERFCPDCNVRLCKACAGSHHKLGHKTVDDKAEINRKIRQILSYDSTPPPLSIAVTDVNKQYDVFCDLCEDERGVSFCEDCQSKLGHFCEESHKKQKVTKNHNITPIQFTKLDILHSKCTICEDRAGTLCTECNLHLCTKCSNDHHKLSDTLTPGKKIINKNQGTEKPLVEERMPHKNQVHGSRSSLARVEPKIPSDDSKLIKSGLSTDKTRTSSSNVDPLNGQNIEEDRPGKPTVESILADSVSLVWNAMDNFCEGDTYEVRIENRQTGTWSAKLFETSRETIEGLQQGTPYVFKVRIVKANGKASKYSENSEKVILKKETKIEEDRPGKPIVERVLADSVNLAWTAADKVSEGDVYQVRIENTKTGKWELKNFKVNRASIGELQTGVTYTFKVRLVRANGVESKYSENSQEVRTTVGTNMKEDRPGKPTVDSIFEDSVILVWTEVDNFSESDVYQVRIENTKTQKWDSKIVSENRARIDGLQPGEPYVFNVRLVRANRQESNYSENSEEVRTKENTKREEYIPEKPSVTKVNADCVDIIWESVHLDKGDVYQVRIDNTETKEWFHQKFTVNNGTIRDLQPGTSYVFKVRLAKANGDDSKYSEDSEEVTTPKTFASELFKFAVAVNTDRKGPSIYAIPLTERFTARNNSAMTKKFDIGTRARQEIDEKTIILVGATGTGKSTLVDGLANYILGVQLHDPWRFTVMPEEDRQKQNNQALSQTDWISCYSFNPQPGSRLKYRLNVIDTPGFGDTRGLERDHKIIDQIRQLFEAKGKTGIQVLDAVCFLIKAPDSRLTATQTYIFNAIMSLFGHDIEDNICTLVTFADGSDPPVLAAVAASGLPFNKTFTFNNSALFSDSELPFTAMFWDMGLESFRKVLKHVSGLQRKSIQLTKEVLQERHSLEVTCQNLQSAVNEGLSAVRNLKKEIDLFKECEAEINRNQNFTYYSKEIQQTKVELPAGKHVTNCLTCNRTCHQECVFADDEDKKKCSAMDASGHCEHCPNKCIWSVHKNALYRIEYIEKEVEKTYEDMQRKYKDAKGKTLSLEQLLKRMKKDLQSRIISIGRMVDRMTKCNNRLQEIALRPNPLGMTDQIDLMIQAEKDEAKPGYQDRIEVLKKFRVYANIDELVNEFMEESLSVQSSLTALPKERIKGLLGYFFP